MKKLIIKFTFMLFFVFLILTIRLVPTYASETKTITDKDVIVDYLSSDEVSSTGYNISDYSSKLIGKNCNISLSSDGTKFLYLNSAVDDDIVNIIPRQFFENVTNKLLIGQEYGFYIKTTFDEYYEVYFSTVLVFDITVKSNLEETIDRVITEIKPLFEYKYINTSKKSFVMIDGIEFKINGFDCIIPYPTLDLHGVLYKMVNDFYLSDICFSGSVFNEQELNYGDVGYSVFKDYGAFITQFDYSYSGLYRKNGTFDYEQGSSVLIDDIMAIFGEMEDVPVVGSYLAGISKIYSMASLADGNVSFLQSTIDSFINGKVESSEHRYTAKCSYLNRDEQLNHYKTSSGTPRLIKNISFRIGSDEQNSIWYGVGNSLTGYFSINNGASNGATPNYTRFTDEIAIKVVNSRDDVETAAIGVLSSTLYEKNIKEIEIDEDKMLYLLPNGFNGFKFSPIYSSDYKISINSNEEVKLNINGDIYSGKQIDIKYYVSSNENVIISILNKNESKSLGTIKITPNDELNNNKIKGFENDYVIKINGLEGINRISTNNDSIIIDNLLVQDNGVMKIFDKYGSYNKSSNIDYIFTDYDCFYIIISNKSDSIVEFSITTQKSEKINDNSIISLEKNIFNYFSYSDLKQGNYILTLSDYVNDNNNFSIRVFDSSYNYVNVTKYFNNIFSFSANDNSSMIIAIYSEYNEDNINFVLKLNDNAYSWQITGGKFNDSFITFERKIGLETGYFYRVSFIINGVVYCTTIKSESNLYGTSLNSYDNTLGLSYDTPVGGDGIELKAAYEGKYDVSFDHTLKIIPIFNSKINDLTSFNEENDYGFKFSIPKYVVKCNYRLSPSNSTSNFIDDSIDLSNGSTTCKKSIINLCKNKYKYHSEIKITITDLFVKDINGNIERHSCDYKTSVDNLFYGGKGTITSPFIIKYFRNFDNIRLLESGGYINYSFILDSNITIPTDYKYSFKTFGILQGTFDGNGKKIINLYCTIDMSSIQQGLFKVNNGTIKNLTIVNYDYVMSNYQTSNTYYAGTFCGINNGSISQCYVNYDDDIFDDDKIENKGFSKNTYQGGICGWNAGSITSCGARVNYKKGYGNKGGIAGYNASNGSINGCGSYGAIFNYYYSPDQDEIFYVGGITGVNYGSVIDCENQAYINFECDVSVSGNRKIQPRMGTIIGLNKGNYSNVSNTGIFRTGELENVTWTTGSLWWKKEYNHNQKEYATGSFCGESN